MTDSFEALRPEFERVMDQVRREIAVAMKEAAAEMEAAKAEIGREMERARREIAAAMAEAASEMEEAKADVKHAMDEARHHRSSKAWDFGQSPEVKRSGKQRRGPPKPRAGEPAPVKPKPKPKPLVGGAEAPLD